MSAYQGTYVGIFLLLLVFCGPAPIFDVHTVTTFSRFLVFNLIPNSHCETIFIMCKTQEVLFDTEKKRLQCYILSLSPPN